MNITRSQLKRIVKEELGKLEEARRSDDDIYEDLKDLVMGLNMMSRQDKNSIIGQAEAARGGGRNKVKINMWIAQTLAQAFPQASSVQRRLNVIMRG